MSILTVEHVTHSFGGRQILDNASFRLLKGEHVGLVGTNGAGKSTFLNIITGNLMPDEGTISWCNRITTGFLDQNSTLEEGKTIRDILRDAFAPMYILEAELLEKYDAMGDCTEDELTKLMSDVDEIQGILDQSGFYNLDAHIEEFANGLGLKTIGLEKDVAELSGGQRTKVLLTKLLLENPMILILDEPTNYLDENHIVWLTRYLQNYENAFILISHDVAFLSQVVNVIYHVEESTLTRYKGVYEEFERMHQLKRRQLEQAYESQQKEIAHLEDFIARNKARIATTNMAKSRQKKLDKMDIITITKDVDKPEFSFNYSRAPSRDVFVAENIVIGYDAPLTKPMTLKLERGQKVAIKGVNGLGKSTLLKSLLGMIPTLSGSVEIGQFCQPAYFEQEADSSDLSAFQTVWDEYPGMTHAGVRGALAKCGLTRDHIDSQMRVLSGGENAKVRLCILMMMQVNLLVLDEPTNHLDVDAKEALKVALQQFNGTILLVSHEPEFYEDIATDIWDLSQWTTKIV